VVAWSFSPNSRRIGYIGTLNGETLPGLFVGNLPIDGDLSPGLSLTPSGGAPVQSDIAWLPGSRVILYRANDAGGAQLHAALLGTDGSALTSQSVSGVFGTGVTSYQVAP
jgi:hypothetical protein